MEIVKVAGVDPGLRYTGYGIVEYNFETGEYKAKNCGIRKSPKHLKGIDALLHMIDEIEEFSEKECFEGCEHIVIEMPAAIYHRSFSIGSLLPVAAISGACFKIFDREKIIPVYPATWNGSKKKEKTQTKTQEILGHYDSWGYEEKPKAKTQFEHILDAASMALWYLKTNYEE